MKRFLILAMAAMLLLAGATTTLAAVHYANSPFTNVAGLYFGNCCNDFFLNSKLPELSGWFSIDPVDPYWGSNLHLSDDVELGMTYYQNDQYFVEGYFAFNDCSYVNFLFDGSFKLENGFFASMALFTSAYDYEGSATLAPGYVYEFKNGKGYVAISADYNIFFSEGTYDVDYETNSGFAGRDLDFVYTGEKYKLFAQIYSAAEELDYDTSYTWPAYKGMYYDLGIIFEASEDLTLGLIANVCSYEDEDDPDSWYKLGFTWQINQDIVLDARYNMVEAYDGDEWEFAEFLLTWQKSQKLSLGFYWNGQGDEYVEYFNDYIYPDRSYGVQATYAISNKSALQFFLQIYEPTSVDISYVCKL